MIHNHFILDIGHGRSVYTGDDPADIVGLLTEKDRACVLHKVLDGLNRTHGLYDMMDRVLYEASGFRCEGARIDVLALIGHIKDRLIARFIDDMFHFANMEDDHRILLEDQSMEFRIENDRLADVTATLTIRMEIGDGRFWDLDRDGREAAVREAIGLMDIEDIADAPMTWEVE